MSMSSKKSEAWRKYMAPKFARALQDRVNDVLIDIADKYDLNDKSYNAVRGAAIVSKLSDPELFAIFEAARKRLGVAWRIVEGMEFDVLEQLLANVPALIYALATKAYESTSSQLALS